MNEATPAAMDCPRRKASLWTVAILFLRLGATSFGGPAVHIALMEEEAVRRRGWLTHEEFLDLLGATNLIPGPNSTELAIHIGHRVAGWRGMLIAGGCFILPAALIVLGFAWAYVTFGQLPSVAALLYGVKPVVIAVIVQALWKLGAASIKTWSLAGLAVLAVVLNAVGTHELLILFGAGLSLAVWQWMRTRGLRPHLSSFAMLLGVGVPAGNAAAAGAPTPFGLGALFLFFLKVGSVLFGSGYVLLAFLRADLVERYEWMNEQQLLDAVAVGQVTPGPVFTTATFIGFLLGGTTGAVVATVGIFLPAFLFVALSVPLIPRMRKSAIAGAFLDGVNVASLALMAVVTWQLGSAAILDLPTAALAAASALLLLRFQVNSAWLILGGAAVGLALPLLQSA